MTKKSKSDIFEERKLWNFIASSKLEGIDIKEKPLDNRPLKERIEEVKKKYAR